MSRLLLILATVGLLAYGIDARQVEPRWFKGNTHTHTLWSDGDAAPRQVCAWYAENGYDFLVLSDHNIMQKGERWFRQDNRRLTEERLTALQERFGDEVVTREKDGKKELRLSTLEELAAKYEGLFLLPGEEVTAHWNGERKHPVHINALGIEDVIPPRGGDSVVDLMNSAIAAINAHGEERGVRVLAHINHPNFDWGITWQQLAQLKGERFFEVYNGHRSVRNNGDEKREGTERMWDLANVLRLTELQLPLLYGVATDDAHNYFGNATSPPGRGWIQVKATECTSDALLLAMQQGEFYASSGVTLEEVLPGFDEYKVVIDAEDGVTYTTRFLGAKKDGELTVFHETTENPAVYKVDFGELFVRAVVTSSEDHKNPYQEGDKQQAWTQPMPVHTR